MRKHFLHERHALQGWGPCSQFHIDLFSFVGAQADTLPHVYIQSGLHGNEQAAMLTLFSLMNELQTLAEQRKINGRITLVPICNPIALSQYAGGELVGRFDQVNGRNFNRGFPSPAQAILASVKPFTNRSGVVGALESFLNADGPTSLAHELQKVLFHNAAKADVVIDCHCDGASLMHLYTPNADHPASAALAKTLRCPVVLEGQAEGNSFEDSLNSFWRSMKLTGDNKEFIAMTLELRGRHDITHDKISSDVDGFLQFLAAMRVIEYPAEALESSASAKLEVMPQLGIEYGVSPVAGLVYYRAYPGQYVKINQTIADIHTLDAHDGEHRKFSVRAKTAGILFSINADQLTYPYRTIYKIAGRTPQLHPHAAQLEP